MTNYAETTKDYVPNEAQRRYYGTIKDDTQNASHQWITNEITSHPGLLKKMPPIKPKSPFWQHVDNVVAGAYQVVNDLKGCALGWGLDACKPLAHDLNPIEAFTGTIDFVDNIVQEVRNGEYGAAAGDLTGFFLVALVTHKATKGIRPGEKPKIPCDSFPPDTQVLMADGTTKAIGDVEVTDAVVAADPQTGEKSPEAVTAKIVTPDDTKFTEVTLSAPEEKAASQTTRTMTLVSTAHHPYWDDTTRTWTEAQDLQTGHLLYSPGHGPVVLLATRTYTTAPQTALNLTVANLHTYYVLAGATPVLVHNSSCGLLTKTDRIAEHLTFRDLDAARRELAGEVVARKPDGTPWDHVAEVRDAQTGLLNRMHQIKVQMSKAGVDDPSFPGLQAELSQASKLLDYSEKYAPRH
ncbi:polymorphic toxin type 28 domain-containing protein [Kitasatospora sp. NPDC101235]|uniref:polymorphic toxin type 28 domain-containing protein n=1 Tax=Kitasatospora sp. NPDC101235 TaxID=3364101 RepID=UPI0037F67F32